MFKVWVSNSSAWYANVHECEQTKDRPRSSPFTNDLTFIRTGYWEYIDQSFNGRHAKTRWPSGYGVTFRLSDLHCCTSLEQSVIRKSVGSVRANIVYNTARARESVPFYTLFTDAVAIRAPPLSMYKPFFFFFPKISFFEFQSKLSDVKFSLCACVKHVICGLWLIVSRQRLLLY